MNTVSLTQPIVDLGHKRDALDSYLATSGYWGTTEDRERYNYVLSPCAYGITQRQQQDLERLGRTLFRAVEDLNQKLCTIGSGKGPSTHDEGRLFRLANTAARSLLRPTDGELRIPPILKVDLVQDREGRYFVVEADAYNPRGLGYIALLEGTVPEQYARYPGVRGVVERLQSLPRWSLIVSEFERYYETPFRIFAQAATKLGVPVSIVREHELALGGLDLLHEGVVTIPESLDQHPHVRDLLLHARTDGRIETFFPPVAYLGSKAFLPTLRLYPGMDEFIPPSRLVGKKTGRSDEGIDFGKSLVLKAAVSSGLKKVFFSDLDGMQFETALAAAMGQKTPGWILQEQVQQEAVPVPVFDSLGARTTVDYFLRITAYICAEEVLYVEVTGRPDRKVHGAPDCIQIPTVLL